MEPTADVVVIGAGHNSLVAAAYCAQAGLRVTVVEERDRPGGGNTTEELTVAGFRHDPAATGHMALQFNPLLADDELGLVRDGLRHVAPDPVLVLRTGPGELLTMHRGGERTAAEIARYSPSDAEAFRGLLADWDDIAEVHLQRMADAPGAVDADPAAAARWAELAAPSAWEHIERRFTDRRTRTLLAWLAGLTTQPISRPGTGMLAVSLPGILSQISWPNAVGGASALTDALVAVIERNAGTVHCGQRVDRVLVEGDRAAGIVTTDGTTHHARRAVISGAHAVHTAAMVGAERLPPEFESLLRWRAGASMFVVHLALPATPRFRGQDGPVEAVIGATGSPEGITGQADDVEAGRLSGPDRWMLSACSSLVDPSRAPAGRATLKLLTAAPYALDGDPANWAAAAPGYADELVAAYAAGVEGFEPGQELGRAVHTPVDLEARNRHNIRGGHQGGEMTPDQMGTARPVRGWSSYRMPLGGLYQTGSSTHPGGPVTGFPGRNAARAVLDDLGIDTGDLMAGPSRVGRRTGPGLR